jgi:hypothetical protein
MPRGITQYEFAMTRWVIGRDGWYYSIRSSAAQPNFNSGAAVRANSTR